MHRYVRAAPGGERVQCGGDLLHRLVGAVVGRPEDRHDPDRVLVAGLGGTLRAEVGHLRPDRDEAGLDVEVAAELLQQTWTFEPITRFGRSVGSPTFVRRWRQRHLRARPPSMHASLEPVVEHPVALEPPRARGGRGC